MKERQIQRERESFKKGGKGRGREGSKRRLRKRERERATTTNIHYYIYGVATISRLLKITGLFCRILSLLWGSFAKETYNFKEPTRHSHPIT